MWLYYLGEPPWSFALPHIGRACGALFVVANSTARLGLVRRDTICHSGALLTRNELATRTWNRQATGSGQILGCAVELGTEPILAHHNIPQSEYPRCCTSLWIICGSLLRG
jgi:hypothetical protein